VVLNLFLYFTLFSGHLLVSKFLAKFCDIVPLEQVQENITKGLIRYVPGLYGHQQVSAIEVCYLGSLPLEAKALDSFAQKPMRKALANVNCEPAIHSP